MCIGYATGNDIQRKHGLDVPLCMKSGLLTAFSGHIYRYKNTPIEFIYRGICYSSKYVAIISAICKYNASGYFSKAFDGL